MLRKAASQALNIPWRELVLARTDANKPYVANPPSNIQWGFNVSHHGHYAVLAGR